MNIESATPAKRRQSIWSWILSIGLAAVLLYFALRGVDWRRVGEMIASAAWKPLLASAAVMCVSFFMRALRWRILLNATTTLSVGEVYWANMAGYFGNQYLPARAGELIRTVLISNRSPLSKTYVFTTALSERLMDVIALVLGSSIVLLGVNPKPAWMQDLSKTMAIAAGAGAIAIMIIPHTGGLLERLIDRMPLPERIRKIAQVLAEQILSGMRAFHDWGRFAAFVMLTVLIWAADAVATIACAQSVGVRHLLPHRPPGVDRARIEQRATLDAGVCGYLSVCGSDGASAVRHRSRCRPGLYPAAAGASVHPGATARHARPAAIPAHQKALLRRATDLNSYLSSPVPRRSLSENRYFITYEEKTIRMRRTRAFFRIHYDSRPAESICHGPAQSCEDHCRAIWDSAGVRI